MFGHFQPAIPRQRAPQGCGEPANLPAQCGDDRSRVFAPHLDQGSKTRMSFHQRRDVTVFCAANEIAFPMAGDGAVRNFSGPFPDGDGARGFCSVVRGIEGTGWGKLFRGTRAWSRRRDTGSSAIQKFVPATNPESVYSLQPSAASHRWPEGTAWAARPSPRLADPPHSLDTQDGRRDVPPPGSPSTPRAPNVWQYHEATNQKRALAKCPLAQPL